MNNKPNSSFKELSQLIVTAIEQEQLFNKEVLIPKIKAILQGFNLKLDVTNYSKTETPSEAGKKIRAIIEAELVTNFWKGELRKIVSDMNPYYEMLNERLVERGFNARQLKPEK